MPTPKVEPSAFSSFMWTGLVGAFVGVGLAEDELAAAEDDAPAELPADVAEDDFDAVPPADEQPASSIARAAATTAPICSGRIRIEFSTRPR